MNDTEPGPGRAVSRTVSRPALGPDPLATAGLAALAAAEGFARQAMAPATRQSTPP